MLGLLEEEVRQLPKLTHRGVMVGPIQAVVEVAVLTTGLITKVGMVVPV
jgi:hypothetical protein